MGLPTHLVTFVTRLNGDGFSQITQFPCIVRARCGEPFVDFGEHSVPRVWLTAAARHPKHIVLATAICRTGHNKQQIG